MVTEIAKIKKEGEGLLNDQNGVTTGEIWRNVDGTA